METQFGMSQWGRRAARTLNVVNLNARPVNMLELEGSLGLGANLHLLADVAEESSQLVPIDVDSVDDDEVVIVSPRAFAEAKNNARRIHGRRVVDVDAEQGNNCNELNGVAVNSDFICPDCLMNLESSTADKRDFGGSSYQAPPIAAAAPPPPPKELKFDCPICMGPLVEEVTTKCGHIFCKACIKTALATKAKCPTCRKKVTMRSVIRIYLPSAS